MVAVSDVKPARTYINPKRALNAGLKLGGGKKNVRVVVAKHTNGRYYPVHVGRITPAEDEGAGEERPTRARRSQAETTRAARQGTRAVAKKAAAKKAVRRKSKNGDSLH